MHKQIELNNKSYIFVKLIITYYIYKLYQLNKKYRINENNKLVIHLGVEIRGNVKLRKIIVISFCF